MVARINILYNAIIDRLLLNELSVVLLSRYLLMKFKIYKVIASVRGNQAKVRRGCIMMVEGIKKLPELMILETSKE